MASPAASGPTLAQALIGIAAAAAGFAAMRAVQPDRVIDASINKLSGVAVNLSYSAEDSREGQPQGFFARGARSVSKALDQAALALEWKSRVLEFNENSPISAENIVSGAVGFTTMLIARRIITIAIAAR